MARRAGSVRWQRPALMALVVSLAVANLARLPAPREPGAPRPHASTVRVVRSRPAVAAPRTASTATGTAAEVPGDWAPSWPVADPEPAEAAGDAHVPAEDAPLAPDAIVALDRPVPEAWRPVLRVNPASITDSASAVAGQALTAVDAVMGSEDGIEGFEPGAPYWFGPRGLEKLQATAMEAQRSMEAQR